MGNDRGIDCSLYHFCNRPHGHIFLMEEIMKKTKAIEEIILLEKITGGDPHLALRNRRVRRAIQTIRHAWAEEKGRSQADINDLLSGSPEWRWPLRIYTSEELKSREERMKAELNINRNIRLSPEPIEKWQEKIVKIIKSVIPEVFNRESRGFIRR